MIRWERATAPSVEPVSIGEAVIGAAAAAISVTGIPTSDAVDALRSCIAQARQTVEEDAEYCNGRFAVRGTITIYLDEEDLIDREGNDLEVLHLPVAPLVSVTSITHYDTDDTAEVVSSSDYTVIPGDYPTIRLADDAEWPSDHRPVRCLAILCTVGHVTAVAAVQQTSTNTETAIVGQTVDVTTASLPLYLSWEVQTYGVTVKVYGSAASDFTGEVCVKTAACSAGGAGYYSTATPAYRYWRVKIASTTSDFHGAATVSGWYGWMPEVLRRAILDMAAGYYLLGGRPLLESSQGWRGEMPDWQRPIRRLCGTLRVAVL